MKKKSKSPADLMDDAIKGFPDNIDTERTATGVMLDLFESSPNDAPDIDRKVRRPVNLKLATIRNTKRLMREVLTDLLNSENENGDSRMEVILDKLVEQSEDGNIKATELITKILGEATDLKVDLNIPDIKIVVSNDTDGIRFQEKPEE